MKPLFFSSAFALALIFSFVGISGLRAQTPVEGDDDQKLQKVFHLDSLFWEAYNRCDADSFRAFFTEDLEFYHDKGGITKSFEKMDESVRNGLCGNNDWRLRRELVEGSLQLYPLHEKGILYGGILSGEHLFFVNKKDKEEYLDGIARFTHLWLLEEGNWKMSRVLSYDHKPATHNPNQKKEFTMSQKDLQQYAGKYEAAPQRTITLSEEPNALKLLDGNFQAMLYPEGKNAFYSKERNVRFEFVRDDKDQVLKMLVREKGEVVDQAEKVKAEKK